MVDRRLESLLKNKVLFYVGSRYATYGIAFVNSILIAAKLGPYNMGIWGFVLLIINYFAQIHFGIGSSLNVLIVHNKDDEKKQAIYINNALALTGLLSLLVIVLYLFSKFIGFSILKEYNAEKYLWMISSIAIMQYFNIVFITLLRIKNLIEKVAFSQSLQIVLQLICVFLFREDMLVFSLVGSYFIANLINIIVALTARILPRFRMSDLNAKTLKEILLKGFYIFIYNSCFVFIILTIRTLISQNYEVDEFGIFTFSFTVANSLILVLDSLSFLIYPKMIHKLSSRDVVIVQNTISNLRTYYISAANFIVFIALLIFPIMLFFLPQYQSGLMVLNTISLATLINAFSFGYTSMLVAKNHEYFLAILSIIVLVINICLASLLIYIIGVPFQFLSISMMFSYIFFCIIIIKKGRIVLNADITYLKKENRQILKISVPLVVAILISYLDLESLIFIPLLLYILINIDDVKKMYKLLKKIVYNPEVFNL